jgi:NADPH:quinone reductase-like Zn-dependent oxidoreductase
VAVEHSSKLDFARELGADEVVDYESGALLDSTHRFDLIVDVASTLEPATWSRLLSSDGKFVLIGHDHYGAKNRRWFGELPRFRSPKRPRPSSGSLPETSWDGSFWSRAEDS